jgi:hypothetical protein
VAAPGDVEVDAAGEADIVGLAVEEAVIAGVVVEETANSLPAARPVSASRAIEVVSEDEAEIAGFVVREEDKSGVAEEEAGAGEFTALLLRMLAMFPLFPFVRTCAVAAGEASSANALVVKFSTWQ